MKLKLILNKLLYCVTGLQFLSALVAETASFPVFLGFVSVDFVLPSGSSAPEDEEDDGT